MIITITILPRGLRGLEARPDIPAPETPWTVNVIAIVIVILVVIIIIMVTITYH